MIVRRILHIEIHRGRWPRISLRRYPRAGDIVWEGMQPFRLIACQPCSGDGHFAQAVRPDWSDRLGHHFADVELDPAEAPTADPGGGQGWPRGLELPLGTSVRLQFEPCPLLGQHYPHQHAIEPDGAENWTRAKWCHGHSRLPASER